MEQNESDVQRIKNCFESSANDESVGKAVNGIDVVFNLSIFQKKTKNKMLEI